MKNVLVIFLAVKNGNYNNGNAILWFISWLMALYCRRNVSGIYFSIITKIKPSTKWYFVWVLADTIPK